MSEGQEVPNWEAEMGFKVTVTGLENLPAAAAPGSDPGSGPAAARAFAGDSKLPSPASAALLARLEGMVRETRELARTLEARRPAVYVGDHLALTRIQHRFFMYADTRDVSITPHLLLDGIWEPALTLLLETWIKPGMTVVDIGANFGYFTLLAAARLHPAEGLVYAFEPNPRSFEILEKNVAVNWLGKWVRAFPCALLDVPAEIELHSAPTLLGSSSFFVTHLEGQNFQPIPVVARPLDEIVTGSVDVMKMDAEGSEPFIFEGMKGVLQRSPRIKIVIEFNVPALEAARVDPRQFLERLRALGFGFFSVTAQGGLEPLQEETLWTGTKITNMVLARG
jgi:FkbM family methyltransferase